MFLTITLLMTVIQVKVSNSLSCSPCCEDNIPPLTELVLEDEPLAVSLLSSEQPSDTECHYCPPPPEYCSTGQSVLDECGCCQVCAKGEGMSVVVCGGTDGTCADDIECVQKNSEDPFDLRGTCQRTVASLGAIGRLRKLLDRSMLWTRRRVLGFVWRAVCSGRWEWLGVLRTALVTGTVIVLGVREMSSEMRETQFGTQTETSRSLYIEH